jgi:hypothetical protein
VATMVQQYEMRDMVKRLSNHELREALERCEDAIFDGTANIEEYETFILCQQELVRRTWS